RARAKVRHRHRGRVDHRARDKQYRKVAPAVFSIRARGLGELDRYLPHNTSNPKNQ
ncbi:hypothetical protein GTK07_08280, partial [Muricauda sp. 40Bstr401]|nr:hypothetical protein [Allomuricauda sediminis]